MRGKPTARLRSQPGEKHPRARGVLLRLDLPQSAALSVHAAYARATYNHVLGQLDTILNVPDAPGLTDPDRLTELFIRQVDAARAAGARIDGGYRPVEVAAVSELAHTLVHSPGRPALRDASRGEHVIIPDVSLRPTGRTPWVTATIPEVGQVAFRCGPGTQGRTLVGGPVSCSLRFARFGAARWYVYVMQGVSVPVLARGRFREPLGALWSSRPGTVHAMPAQGVGA